MATQAQLDDAEKQYHDLMTGVKARVVVDSNGERVEFTPVTAGRLKAYIDTLRHELNSTRRGTLGVYF